MGRLGVLGGCAGFRKGLRWVWGLGGVRVEGMGLRVWVKGVGLRVWG